MNLHRQTNKQTWLTFKVVSLLRTRIIKKDYEIFLAKPRKYQFYNVSVIGSGYLISQLTMNDFRGVGERG